MARERRGFIVQPDHRLYARVGYTDELGRRRDIIRRDENFRPLLIQMVEWLCFIFVRRVVFPVLSRLGNTALTPYETRPKLASLERFLRNFNTST